MLYTIETNYYKMYRRFLKRYNYCCIELDNGIKCNHSFYWYCVELGIIDPYKD